MQAMCLFASGENIAVGYVTPEQVAVAWMASPGHRANILYPDFQHIGADKHSNRDAIANGDGDMDGNGNPNVNGSAHRHSDRNADSLAVCHCDT